MIDWTKSAEMNKMEVEELKIYFIKYPCSNKKIVAICEGCGAERELYFQAFRELCKKCKMNTPETRRKYLESINQYYITHPESREKISKRVTQYNIDHPEARDAASKKTIEYFSDPAARAASSARLKKYYRDNPEKRSAATYQLIKYHLNNPEAREEFNNMRRRYPEMFNTEFEKMRGGHDTILHHYMYDDADKSKYTMSMTRSEHTTMHNRMRLASYEVPHINSAVDSDTLWGYNMVV